MVYKPTSAIDTSSTPRGTRSYRPFPNFVEPQARRSHCPCTAPMQSAIATPMPARLSTMSPLYPPAAHGELSPVEHNLALIPTPISDGDPTVLCRVKRKGCAVRLKKRSSFMCFHPWRKRAGKDFCSAKTLFALLDLGNQGLTPTRQCGTAGHNVAALRNQ